MVCILPFGAMRRNGARFALLSACPRGHQTLLLRLSAVLRNALVLCGKFISHWNFFHKSTWPEFQPSLPRGHVWLDYVMICSLKACIQEDSPLQRLCGVPDKRAKLR